ncbi:DUF296 domain-containing protein [Micromonospora sp. NPDC049523]|uniref:PPC domain-containing DNA-binding protein n=1 Tax=Micromonospora sp. NPDC049523 TaxID=3155921 RepID=UPI003444D374
MRSHEVTVGRTLAVIMEHGEDFYAALAEACQVHGIRQGYIPMFIGGMSSVEIVGTCERLEDPQAPVWSKVHLTNVEALGAGTLAYDDTTDAVLPHIHVSVGLKAQSAVGHTSHLLAATVQFVTELVIIEVTQPVMSRPRQPRLYDVPLLRIDSAPGV